MPASLRTDTMLVGAVFLLAAWMGSASATRAAERVEIRVRETAGIRRFGYPVDVFLRLKRPVDRATTFRLLDGEMVIAAQFRPEPGEEATTDLWWLDFPLSLLPGEQRDLRVEYGLDVPAPPERTGLRLVKDADALRIHYGNELDWTVPLRFDRFLSAMRIRGRDQLQNAGARLELSWPDGSSQTLASLVTDPNPPGVTVQREGPHAIQLRWTGVLEAKDWRASAQADLHFPLTKSWVRVDWQLSDVRGVAPEMLVVVPMRLDPLGEMSHALVDFGAGSWVYAALAEGEECLLEAPASASSWQIFKGPASRLDPFVTGVQGQHAEGWAHVMDAQRCLALAVADFAQVSRDQLHIAADGMVRIQRSLPPSQTAGKPVRMRCWLHFVANPPHISALTSPQSMLAPLQVDVRHP